MSIRKHGAVALKVAFTCGVMGSVAFGLQSRGGDESSKTRMAQEAAFKKGGLQAAAAIGGTYTRRIEDRWEGDPLSLRELAELSTLIVIGTTNRATCHITGDGRSVETAFAVDLETIVKGGGGVTSVQVFTPGGKTGFADGSTAEVRTSGFLRPQIGHRAVWFLQPRADGGYKLSRGRLGVYDLEPDLSRRKFVVPAGGFETLLARRLIADKLSPQQFVQEVWNAAK